MVKVGSDGALQWDRTYGGAKHDFGSSVAQTSEGGYIITGGTSMLTGTTMKDFYAIKTDADGNVTQ